MGTHDPSRRSVMAWQSTLSMMRAHSTRVRRVCSCGFWKDVDVAEMEALLGADGSLWDRRPPCDRCDRLSHFMASPGPGSPFLPLLSPSASSMDNLPPQAWMAGWTGQR